jgi:ribonuclease D
VEEERTPPAVREEPLVDEQALLDELGARLTAADEIALDTEFVRESTYYPRLCLLQIATEAVIFGVDCLAALDLGPLLELIYRAGCTWVLHSARQDLEVLWNTAERLPSALFDTQIAAALIGFAPQVGLQELVAKTVGVDLPKGHARTDWSRRPLPDAALRYAIDDVRYLLAARRHLERRLEQLGRLTWCQEDNRRLLREPPAADVPTVFARTKGVWQLDDAGLHAAYALVRWRESKAKRRDRPRRWILGDEALLRIARTRPDSAAALRRVPDVPKRLAARSGAEILDALRHADQADVSAAIDTLGPPPAADKARLKALQSQVRQRADDLGLSADVLATRRDLALVAAGRPAPILTTGWRATVLADILSI